MWIVGSAYKDVLYNYFNSVFIEIYLFNDLPCKTNRLSDLQGLSTSLYKIPSSASQDYFFTDRILCRLYFFIASAFGPVLRFVDISTFESQT